MNRSISYILVMVVTIFLTSNTAVADDAKRQPGGMCKLAALKAGNVEYSYAISDTGVISNTSGISAPFVCPIVKDNSLASGNLNKVTVYVTDNDSRSSVVCQLTSVSRFGNGLRTLRADTYYPYGNLFVGEKDLQFGKIDTEAYTPASLYCNLGPSSKIHAYYVREN